MRPTSSSSERAPSAASCARTSSASIVKNATTCSGVPRNRARKVGSCVAMPTEQVLRWHLRSITQPVATRDAVARPYSSAPSSVATITSRAVRRPPSTCRRTRPRSRWCTSTWCASARPSSHGMPAWRRLDSGDAPVPPSKPAITIAPARALATPAAIVPTPTSLTSFTDTRAVGLIAVRS